MQTIALRCVIELSQSAFLCLVIKASQERVSNFLINKTGFS
jgi:hypothetical protein